jgi:hypothetical protein
VTRWRTAHRIPTTRRKAGHTVSYHCLLGIRCTDTRRVTMWVIHTRIAPQWYGWRQSEVGRRGQQGDREGSPLQWYEAPPGERKWRPEGLEPSIFCVQSSCVPNYATAPGRHIRELNPCFCFDRAMSWPLDQCALLFAHSGGGSRTLNHCRFKLHASTSCATPPGYSGGET